MLPFHPQIQCGSNEREGRFLGPKGEERKKEEEEANEFVWGDCLPVCAKIVNWKIKEQLLLLKDAAAEGFQMGER